MKYDFIELVTIIVMFMVAISADRMFERMHSPRVITDGDTGCQYLSLGSGSLTPRIGADYMHKGCKGVE